MSKFQQIIQVLRGDYVPTEPHQSKLNAGCDQVIQSTPKENIGTKINQVLSFAEALREVPHGRVVEIENVLTRNKLKIIKKGGRFKVL